MTTDDSGRYSDDDEEEEAGGVLDVLLGGMYSLPHVFITPRDFHHVHSCES